ncbi:GGDEF domain-containing protein [Butyrivibrio sp. XB500-5]|uniref:GGDEF domain-containing protein n=1 Tax=Butyrivibrio sp. XB500-5 TaxID=2364880 RepID=UPI000EAA3378|nr:GGDEF domain-containing protein [Butyrivibrio sp. XB500-5]RKM61796.1 GGDEF domain-containing protein [Butyrivibrio sp. XB500-5]
MLTKKRVIATLLSILIMVIIFSLCQHVFAIHPDYPIAFMDEGWDVTINTENYKNIKMSEVFTVMDSKLKHGDVIFMSKTLPDLGEIPFPAISFRSRYTTLECFIDGELIYKYGLTMYREDKFIGKMMHFITLPNDYAGKQITFKMLAEENDAFTVLEGPSLGSTPELRMNFINSHLFIIAAGMALFVFGIVFLMLSLLFVTAIPDIAVQLYSSLMCINLGAWLLSYYNVLSLFVYAPLETQIEYFTLYLIVPFCYIILYCIQKPEKKKLFFAFFIISSLIPFFQFILHFSFNIHLRATLPMYHVDCVVGFIVVIYYTINSIRKKNISSAGMIQMIGLFIFTIAEFIHLIVYILGPQRAQITSLTAKVTIAGGCLFFVICQIAFYLLYITKTFAQRQEYASLSRLAYADGLTNLSNRAKSDKALMDLNKAKTDYCIISIDLNGLKPINDKYGHLSGDKYIKDFAKVLTNTFEELGLCARIGGDEFLVIIEDASDLDIEALIGRMNSALSVMNALYPEYQRSVASGYAYKHECPDKDSHEVYLLADQRMYENKRRMHEELGIALRV